MTTKSLHSNCFFGILYLLLRGKIKKIVGISTQSKLWPIHYMGLTKNGHAIHFRFSLEDKYNQYEPYWFIGHYELISKHQIYKVLEKSKRKLLFTTEKVNRYLVLLILIYILCFIPFLVLWFVQPFITNISGILDALKKKK